MTGKDFLQMTAKKSVDTNGKESVIGVDIDDW